MPDIRYVCLSDMHLGEEDSLLTNMKVARNETEPGEPSPVLSSLVECLRDLIQENEHGERPTLILNGDILELALALTHEAAMAFERFMELIKMPDGRPLFEQIIYIPGNHDHHIWEIARETRYVHYIESVKTGATFRPSRHTTGMFVDSFQKLVPSYFLTNLVQRHAHLQKMEIKVAYPNFGLRSENGEKCVVFHHGHFTESIYQLMSTFRSLLFGREMPDSIE
ncbi:MAG: metallophosphoesterase, partial [Syntrophobacteria bacterium]